MNGTRVWCFRSTEFYWSTLWTRLVIWFEGEQTKIGFFVFFQNWISAHRIHAMTMDVVYLIYLVIAVNVMKDIQVKIVMVIQLVDEFDLWIRTISSSVRVAGSGCASNPCSVGICYQLSQNGPSYVCICPDGTLNLSCNSSSTLRRFIFALFNLPTMIFRCHTQSLRITDTGTRSNNDRRSFVYVWQWYQISKWSQS